MLRIGIAFDPRLDGAKAFRGAVALLAFRARVVQRFGRLVILPSALSQPILAVATCWPLVDLGFLLLKAGAMY